MAFERKRAGARLAELAAAGVYAGASSWKYPGWREQLYETARYERRGAFSLARFERNCLAEYAGVFKTVCVDAAYYKYPEADALERLAGQVPRDFRFAFKVTDEITRKHFGHRPRGHPPGAGAPAHGGNPHYLDAGRFEARFLHPCRRIQDQVGLLIFEFSRFSATDYRQGREFVADLHRFLDALPKGLSYGVELRNREWLRPEYFDCLAEHGVAHVLNSWEAMPPVDEQMALISQLNRPPEPLAPTAARFLLKPGRRYADAVRRFQPYDRAQEVNVAARAAGRRLIAAGVARPPGAATFIYVNNRLEGNALETIAAMIASEPGPPASPMALIKDDTGVGAG